MNQLAHQAHGAGQERAGHERASDERGATMQLRAMQRQLDWLEREARRPGARPTLLPIAIGRLRQEINLISPRN
jgi:hypothetical protein